MIIKYNKNNKSNNNKLMNRQMIKGKDATAEFIRRSTANKYIRGEIVPLSYCSREERQAMRSSFARQWQKDFSCMFRDDLIGGPS